MLDEQKASAAGLKARAALTLGVLGVVYGDIGTSPLYALREAVTASGGVSEPHVMGVLSLMAWSLFLVVTVKYVLVILRVDNRGEGGILALTALALKGVSSGRRHWWLLAFGLLGAALFYGDSVITPAISVLSAMEGLEVVAPSFAPYVLPGCLILLLGLFIIQQFGTARVGLLFGPIIAVWFLVLAVLGLRSIVENPSILYALDPRYGIDLIAANPSQGFVIMGAVVLTVTGAEALYADLGHFGRRPVAVTWLRFVFPALLINYLGQGALVLRNPETLENPFYLLAPTWAVVPLILLAAMATIIASQAVISGAFSLTQQAVQLGYLPRLRIRHTSAEARGQVYVPVVNMLLLVLVAFVVLEFGSSSRLAAAYGIAVTGTMIFTSLLAAVAVYATRGWRQAQVLPIFAVFLLLDLLFFASNLEKITDGGWLPLALAVLVFAVMRTWIVGRQRLLQRRIDGAIPLNDFLKSTSLPQMRRVQGTAVYLVAEPRYTPTALLHNIKHNEALHERVVVVAVRIEEVPHVPAAERVTIESHPQGFFTALVRYGFAEEPHVPRVLVQCRAQGLDFVLEKTSFFIGREKVTVGRTKGMATWRKRFFILLTRSMVSVPDYFHLPPNRVVELGGQIDL